MTAALYALRSGKSVLILEKENFGGQIAVSPRVENFPSIKEISGLDLSNNMFEQITSLGAKFELEDVKEVIKQDDHFVIKTNYSVHESKTVIISNGVVHRHTGVKDEEKYIGDGVSYCALCDGPFYKGEDVILIGDANTALQYALLLSNYCKSVQIATLFDKFFADEILIKRIKDRTNITYQHNLSLSSFDGDPTLTGATFQDTKTKQLVSFKAKAVFVAIGQIPNNEIFANLVDLDHGYIVANDKMETKTKGMYVAGDTRKKDIRQLITATSDGAIAAMSAIKYIDQ